MEKTEEKRRGVGEEGRGGEEVVRKRGREVETGREGRGD